MKCTQYGFCEQGAFKNARAILFFIHIYIIYFGGGGGSQAGQATIYGRDQEIYAQGCQIAGHGLDTPPHVSSQFIDIWWSHDSTKTGPMGFGMSSSRIL